MLWVPRGRGVSLAVAHLARKIDILHKHSPTHTYSIHVHQMQDQLCINPVGRRSDFYLIDPLRDDRSDCESIFTLSLCDFQASQHTQKRRITNHCGSDHLHGCDPACDSLARSWHIDSSIQYWPRYCSLSPIAGPTCTLPPLLRSARTISTVRYESMCLITDGISGRRVLPVSSRSNGPLLADMSEDRRLPPLPCVEPLPRGPLDPFSANAYASSASRSQYTCPDRSTRRGVEGRAVTMKSSACSVECSLQSDQSQKVFTWPQELSCPQFLNLIAPTNINRKPPLQQQCGRKRKASMAPAGLENQRERHRIAEGTRQKNLCQLHCELDSRIHNFFLEQAGWNPSKGLSESKEQIIQAAIFLIDYMARIIKYFVRQENKIPRQLLEYLAPLPHTAAAAGVQSLGAEPDFPAAAQKTSGRKPNVDGL
ncbi:hypothetical protein BO71DRAFT_478082 [Aspergillus ellipticus CBS 707.79]|uniref:Uncharacterized protein n=1 Tax=Aspergillus ellipticus CBS 707.79 TaxID=1448320 RepID=A0A319D818_9EURO|nr:hypothetical protein BO71DRAFT_478082 [Aspergillus ellipticus CBS 707.79]